jgi:hypothetical protein
MPVTIAIISALNMPSLIGLDEQLFP